MSLLFKYVAVKKRKINKNRLGVCVCEMCAVSVCICVTLRKQVYWVYLLRCPKLSAAST